QSGRARPVLRAAPALAPGERRPPEVGGGPRDRFLGEQAFVRAEEAYLRAQAAGAPHPDLRLRAGLLALACGRPEQAEAALREAAQGPTLGEAWTALGDLAARRGDLTAAVSWWQAALGAGRRTGLLERIGWAELHRGHFWEARSALEAAWTEGGQTCPVAFGLAVLSAHEAPTAGLQWIHKPCQEAPWARLWTWWPALAPDALDRGRLEEALARAAEATDPVQRAAHLGQTFTALGLPSLAEQEWLTVLSQRPDWGTAWAHLGHARALLGKPALEDLERAVALEPRSEEAWYFLGRWWAANGVPQAAAEAFRKGLKAHPESLALTLELAYALAAARDYTGAGALFSQAQRLAQGDAGPSLAEARFYLEHLVQVRERGLPAAERAVDLAPSSAEAHELLGWAAWLAGDAHRAEAELAQALEMAPHLASAWYHWATMLAAQGRAMAAREAYLRAVVLDPSGFYGARAAKALREMQACSGPLESH
ncbi:MAG: tetratricopeptide repeat protein, partial [Anaerolineae bacterium]